MSVKLICKEMADNTEKPVCKYGANCYRLNPAHKDQFSHPTKGRTEDDSDDDGGSKSPQPPTKKQRPSTSPPKNDSDAEKSSESDNNENTNEDVNRSENEEKTDNESENNAAVADNESNSNGSSSKHDTAGTEATDKPSSTSTQPVGIRCSEFIKENFDKGPHAQRAEYRKLLDSPADFISSKFLVKMPNDFFAFWEFCEAESKNDAKPETLFKKFGLNLVGPFDVLAKKFDNVEPFEPGEYLRHWRFYYDPPEFQVSRFLVGK